MLVAVYLATGIALGASTFFLRMGPNGLLLLYFGLPCHLLHTLTLSILPSHPTGAFALTWKLWAVGTPLVSGSMFLSNLLPNGPYGEERSLQHRLQLAAKRTAELACFIGFFGGGTALVGGWVSLVAALIWAAE